MLLAAMAFAALKRLSWLTWLETLWVLVHSDGQQPNLGLFKEGCTVNY